MAQRDVNLVNWIFCKEKEKTNKAEEAIDPSKTQGTENPVITPEPSAEVSEVEQPLYGMPLNAFSGQTVTSTNALLAQPSYHDSLVTIPSSVGIR